MQNSVQDLLACCCTAKGTYLTAKKFAELDGARNCVATTTCRDPIIKKIIACYRRINGALCDR